MMDGWFSRAAWNIFFMFYSASVEETSHAWTEYALKFILFFKYDRRQLASKVLPEPIGPANKNPLHAGIPNWAKTSFF